MTKYSNSLEKKVIEVVDLFCGIGGLTCGLRKVGFNVIAGFDIDDTCKYAYEKNNGAKFYKANIREVTGNEIKKLYSKGSIKVLVGCAPCQPFSLLRKKMGSKNFKDEKYDLLLEFKRLIEEVVPDMVSMENVPQIQKSNVFKKFVKTLKDLKYSIDYKIVYCPEYGIPQNRKRLLLLASKFNRITLSEKTHKVSDVKISNFIRALPKIQAGETCSTDTLHKCASLSPINIQRIKQSIPGGTWKDWPIKLRCKCHLKESGKTFTAPYSRLEWDKISSTITTEFVAYGSGRFGHPDQDRALSLREGAILQTFPKNYIFDHPKITSSFRDIARQIGNAVPPRLGEVIGRSIINHMKVENIICRQN